MMAHWLCCFLLLLPLFDTHFFISVVIIIGSWLRFTGFDLSIIELIDVKRSLMMVAPITIAPSDHQKPASSTHPSASRGRACAGSSSHHFLRSVLVILILSTLIIIKFLLFASSQEALIIIFFECFFWPKMN